MIGLATRAYNVWIKGTILSKLTCENNLNDFDMYANTKNHRAFGLDEI